MSSLIKSLITPSIKKAVTTAGKNTAAQNIAIKNAAQKADMTPTEFKKKAKQVLKGGGEGKGKKSKEKKDKIEKKSQMKKKQEEYTFMNITRIIFIIYIFINKSIYLYICCTFVSNQNP